MDNNETEDPFFPETREQFIARIKARTKSKLQDMVDHGVFESVGDDANGIYPIPFPKKYKISELEGWTMANILVDLGIFPSVTQARKNGWDKPLTTGIHSFTKKKIHVEIVE